MKDFRSLICLILLVNNIFNFEIALTYSEECLSNKFVCGWLLVNSNETYGSCFKMFLNDASKVPFAKAEEQCSLYSNANQQTFLALIDENYLNKLIHSFPDLANTKGTLTFWITDKKQFVYENGAGKITDAGSESEQHLFICQTSQHVQVKDRGLEFMRLQGFNKSISLTYNKLVNTEYLQNDGGFDIGYVDYPGFSSDADDKMFLRSGGQKNSAETAQTVSYNIFTRKWSNMADLNTARSKHCQISVKTETGDGFFAIGGVKAGADLNSIEFFNFANNQWQIRSETLPDVGGAIACTRSLEDENIFYAVVKHSLVYKIAYLPSTSSLNITEIKIVNSAYKATGLHVYLADDGNEYWGLFFNAFGKIIHINQSTNSTTLNLKVIGDETRTLFPFQAFYDTSMKSLNMWANVELENTILNFEMKMGAWVKKDPLTNEIPKEMTSWVIRKDGFLRRTISEKLI